MFSKDSLKWNVVSECSDGDYEMSTLLPWLGMCVLLNAVASFCILTVNNYISNKEPIKSSK